MFARLPALVTFTSLALLAVATPAPAERRGGKPPPPTSAPHPTVTVTVTAPAPAPTGASACSTGPIQCCNSVESAGSAAGSLLLGLLGIVVEGVDVLLGINCSPITVIGVGGSGACSSNVVCCENNNVGGLISIGCVPVIL
ncbi:fungal hydrophobin [Pilatotrama ljubarskyi]|nr:fungal hydrophobin [Pilatotrama ljubarskyi]